MRILVDATAQPSCHSGATLRQNRRTVTGTGYRVAPTLIDSLCPSWGVSSQTWACFGGSFFSATHFLRIPPLVAALMKSWPGPAASGPHFLALEHHIAGDEQQDGAQRAPKERRVEEGKHQRPPDGLRAGTLARKTRSDAKTARTTAIEFSTAGSASGGTREARHRRAGACRWPRSRSGARGTRV